MYKLCKSDTGEPCIWDSIQGRIVMTGDDDYMRKTAEKIGAEPDEGTTRRRYLVTFDTQPGGDKHWFIHIDAKHESEADRICAERWASEPVYSIYKRHNVKVELEETDEDYMPDFRILHAPASKAESIHQLLCGD